LVVLSLFAKNLPFHCSSFII